MALTQQQVLDSITEQAIVALRQQEEGAASDLLALYQSTQEQIIAKIQTAFPGESWDLVSMQNSRIQALLQQINAEIMKLNGAAIGLTSDATAQQFNDSASWSAYALDQATPANIAINYTQLPDTTLRAILSTPFQGAQFSQRYGMINDAMASDIRDQLMQSMINGESMDDASARVSTAMGGPGGGWTGGYAGRADSIARTEIMRASNLAAQDVFQNQNKDIMEDEPEWFATPDDRECPWCAGRDGKTATQIRKLSLHARGKSDPFKGSATMPLHPHCRCRWMPRLKTWKDLGIDIPEDAPDTARSMRLADGSWGEVPVQSYDAWQAARGL